MEWTTTTTVIAIGAVAAACTAFFTGRRYFLDRSDKRLKEAEERAEWKGRTDESVANLKTSIAKIEGYLLALVQKFVPDAVLATTRGKEVSKSLGGVAWARQTAAGLELEETKEAFEVYEFAKGYVEDDSHFSEEFMRQMRRSAYETNVEMAQIRVVLAIELRDALLANLPDDG